MLPLPLLVQLLLRGMLLTQLLLLMQPHNLLPVPARL
jgi:hypothetical protein